VVAVRPVWSLETVLNAYRSSNGCLTPALIGSDMSGMLKGSKAEMAEGRGMFGSMSDQGFLTYVTMIGRLNGCGFRAH